MNNIKDQENINQKVILLRLDLNVPLKNGVITDQTRIDKILPVINFLIKKNCKIIIISHVGRPKGKVNKELSLKPICKNLESKINQKIKLINENFEIEKGFMTTIHSFTTDQRILDNSHKDIRRARTASQSIVPTSTGA